MDAMDRNTYRVDDKRDTLLLSAIFLLMGILFFVFILTSLGTTLTGLSRIVAALAG